MNIVYIILAHKNPDQLVRLVKKLQASNTTILIHVDKKMDTLGVKQITRMLNGCMNIHLLPRYYVRWAGFSGVRATNTAICQIFSKKYPCDYAILLSGQDYPIKSVRSLNQFLENNRGKSFIEFRPMPIESWPDGGLPRFQKWHFELAWVTNDLMHYKLKHYLELFFNKVFPNRTFPTEFQPYAGSEWWVLDRDCLEYVNSFNRVNTGFIHFFNNVYIADELFFQTILLNSPFVSRLENYNLTYRDWSKGGRHPKTLLVEDFEQLVKSDKFFARKFDTNVDRQILEMLDMRCKDKSC